MTKLEFYFIYQNSVTKPEKMTLHMPSMTTVKELKSILETYLNIKKEDIVLSIAKWQDTKKLDVPWELRNATYLSEAKGTCFGYEAK